MEEEARPYMFWSRRKFEIEEIMIVTCTSKATAFEVRIFMGKTGKNNQISERFEKMINFS